MILVPILLSLIAVAIISLIVFGGGQVFIPMFQWLWTTLNNTFSLDLDPNSFDAVITVANLTPGTVSTKLAAMTGILISANQWWGFLVLILSYAVFMLPAMFIMYFASKLFYKIKNKKWLVYIQWFKPVIAGILIALALQLFLGAIIPHTVFNQSLKNYIGDNSQSAKNLFFNGWRLYALYVWGPILVLLSLFFYWKKINFIFIFFIAIVLSLIVFQPWLS
ncbi:chromate transporter [Mycoplasmoides fastidiosum]|uniref:Chromate transporter n=1 Tax=Mycoplasmoides fastidiosum TaxID=92758 RepID=A0ABU0LYS8_9BACT|nr:chromate transporter [Mycoplasmoides fastidiosum]MDQ0513845.1 chromate transporter [Mycoplasmoides fastidiosum]UUD37739.1 chromate transporter [Mycoplasmoides fastidiosum]